MTGGPTNNPTTEPERQSATVADQLAREIKRLRTEAGLSQRVLASKIGYSRQYVTLTEWEDATLPSRDLVAALDTGLGANGALIALREQAQSGQRASKDPDIGRGRPPGANSETADRVLSEESQSRWMFDNAVEEATEDLIDVLGRVHRLTRSINPDIISTLQGNTLNNIEQYESLDFSKIAPNLVKQRAFIDTLIDECNHSLQRRNLFEVAGQTSGLLGYITVGRGDFALARAYCLEASQLGDLVEDANLRAWVCGLQSFCEYYAGNYDGALKYAQEGLAYAKSGPQSARLMINGAARAMGKLGDNEGVRRAVDESYELISQNNAPSGVPSSVSLKCYSSAQLAGNAATAYLSLTKPNKVEEYVQLALPEMSLSQSPWGRSLVMIDLARSKMLTKDADMDHAAALMIEALTISTGKPMISIQQRASEFVHDTAERWGNIAQLTAVRDALSNLREC